MNEKLSAQRNRRASGHSPINVAHISFSAWDPDGYLTQLDQKIGKFIYSSWLTWLTVLLFIFEGSSLPRSGTSSDPTSRFTSASATNRFRMWWSSGCCS